MTSGDRVWGIVILIFGCVYLQEGIRIPPAAIGDPLGPRVFPSILGTLMAASGIYLILKPAPGRAQPVLLRSSFFPVLILFSLLILYSLSLAFLGYLLATFLFVLAVTLIMGERSAASSLAISASFSLGVFLLFTRVLTIPLPLGFLKFLGLR